MNFLKEVVKEIDNEYAGLVSDGVAAGDTSGFIDTGSYIFNALVSGSVYGGVPGNKITAIAGESSTGKTFFCLGIVQHFLDSNPDAGVIYFESESAISKQMIEDRGIASDRMMIVPVSTIEEFRTQSCRILDKYMEQKEDERKPLMFVLDSLGMLASNKEVEDVANDKQVRDMTKSQLIKGAFRVLTLKLGKANVPMLVTNHTYDVIGSYVPMKEMGGGSGLKYASSTIIYLSKKKEKDGTDVVGNIIKCKAQKSRLTKENSQIETRLYYDRGLDKYYGLLELGEKYGMWKNVAGRYEMNGKKVYAKAILKDPETYFTEEVMQALDEAAAKEFRYGS
ncbi:recombination protein [Cyanophage S-RIM12_RW_29_1109]|uniref:Recombination protein n=7 Tax=Brizovirus TaxID=2733098 RepID=A0A1D7SX43_9CAUD|nr:UvsX RecA-like protein [Prochlorococcus phage Syn33]YP_009779142.1 recombinase [Cyanophage S-RIM12 isolate RW_01_0310]YP_009779353.1 recombinase [Cyanophage S-RIM12 isolate RW_06_0310]YP_009779568.1 recombinase [Cyanophage S-RIM12 isolate W1_08_0910]AOO15222.1 recombination protein [Cyanophage S-RIM12_Np_14_0310]AOO15431.1 recombination protein [Cyanophage S-RIM12_Np_15_0310]AOO15649.1 recombination protein [Cyanophage S-RIM12_Np_22_1112]AOO16071.1 recombination protein [Cyanophage S-RIM1